MGGAIVTELATEILIPASAAVGIAYALVQWILVARVRLSPESEAAPPQRGSGDGGVGGDKNGYEDFLIEGEEGINNRDVVVKCAEIQSAISEVWPLTALGIEPKFTIPRSAKLDGVVLANGFFWQRTL